jgi:predicted ATPase
MFKTYLCIVFCDFWCIFLYSGRTHTRRYQQHTPARYRHQHGGYCPGETNTPQLLRQRSKKRSSSLQREELLQIIQANMEKNNLSFQTSRYASLKEYHSEILVYESGFYNYGDFVKIKEQTMFLFCKLLKRF